jgi:hypothetical protein
MALLAGCGTTAMDSESTREIVLQYLGADAAVGTAGPFGKGGKKEIDVLSAADRKQVDDLIDRGAVLFLVYAATTPAGAAGESPVPGSNVSRVIVVHGGKVVGDFRVTARAG